MRNFVVYHLPAIAYAALIIGLSSIHHLPRPYIDIFKIDKVLHFLEYAFFAFLIFRSFTHLPSVITARYAVYFSAFFISLFALFDEYYQSHIPGRDSDLVDAAFDILGGLLIIALMSFRKKHGDTIIP
jgi:VanZ family protein